MNAEQASWLLVGAVASAVTTVGGMVLYRGVTRPCPQMLRYAGAYFGFSAIIATIALVMGQPLSLIGPAFLMMADGLFLLKVDSTVEKIKALPIFKRI